MGRLVLGRAWKVDSEVIRTEIKCEIIKEGQRRRPRWQDQRVIVEYNVSETKRVGFSERDVCFIVLMPQKGPTTKKIPGTFRFKTICCFSNSISELRSMGTVLLA